MTKGSSRDFSKSRQAEDLSKGSSHFPSYLCESKDDVLIYINLQPKAARNAFVGLHDGHMKVALRAPPVDGKANDALVEFLAQELGIAKSRVILVKGLSQRKKVLRIEGLSLANVHSVLVTHKKC
jgi:uncharacterized protein (TIGR00251 family)